MTPETITELLTELFDTAVEASPPDRWQIVDGDSRLLILLSEDQSWLRVLMSIAPAQDAQSLLAQLLEANFDETQEARYALYQNVLWGVFQHAMDTLTAASLKQAIARLIHMRQNGLSEAFQKVAESQIRQIIYASKMQGQSIETTMRTLERFYQEGVMGELSQDEEQRERVLGAWRYQLERLWDEVGDEG
ncbi:MAG: type III secretion system chaperone [Cyanobacteria bacterium J06626_14]